MSIRVTDFLDLVLKCLIVICVMNFIFFICYVTVEFSNCKAASVEDKYELPECKSYEH